MKQHFYARLICLLLLAGLIAAAPAAGVAEETLDDVLSGFDESAALSDSTDTDLSRSASRWDIQGALTLASTYNVNHDSPPPGQTDHRGLSRLRAELALQLDVDLYDTWSARISGRGFYDNAYEIQGRSDYTRQFLDEYEDEIEFRETYIEGTPTPSTDVKVGRQIVVWGNTENFRVTDVLNPVDNRTPGLVNIEDLRLPVCMAKVDYYWGDYSLTGAVIPELRFSKNPVFGSDFFPAGQPLPREERLSQDADNAELAMAFTGILSGWDFGLYAARYFNDDSYYKTVAVRQVLVGQVEVAPGVFQPVYQPVPVYERRHAELDMGGFMVNVASGDWLFKTEMAYSDGYRFNQVSDEKSRLDSLLGVEYTGLTNTTMTLEVVQNHYLDYDDEMRLFPDYVEETEYQVAFRYSQDLMYDRLELTFLAMLMEVDGDDAAIERLSAGYDVTDAVVVTGGVIFYQGGDKVGYETIHKNNRIFLDVEYSF